MEPVGESEPEYRVDASQGIAGLSGPITGGGSDIGLGTALRLVRDVARVTTYGRTEERLRRAAEMLDRTALQLVYVGCPEGSVAFVAAEVADEGQVAHAVSVSAAATGSVSAAATGRPNVLVANAGGAIHMGPLPGRCRARHSYSGSQSDRRISLHQARCSVRGRWGHHLRRGFKLRPTPRTVEDHTGVLGSAEIVRTWRGPVPDAVPGEPGRVR